MLWSSCQHFSVEFLELLFLLVAKGDLESKPAGTTSILPLEGDVKASLGVADFNPADGRATKQG